jgi:DinB superfamily
MDDIFKQCFWKNFGAAIDMLKNAVSLCPDELWQKEKKFFYLTYHTTIFLDYYLTIPAKDFHPALPYTITDENNLPAEAVDDVIPNRYYSRQEVLAYLTAIRGKCKKLIITATKDKLMNRWIEDDEINMHGLCPPIVKNYPVLEILFYNFRHIQHHVGQLNFILRQKINTSPGWISLVEEP